MASKLREIWWQPAVSLWCANVLIQKWIPCVFNVFANVASYLSQKTSATKIIIYFDIIFIFLLCFLEFGNAWHQTTLFVMLYGVYVYVYILSPVNTRASSLCYVMFWAVQYYNKKNTYALILASFRLKHVNTSNRAVYYFNHSFSLISPHQTTLGLYSINHNTSYHQISRMLEAAWCGFGFVICF